MELIFFDIESTGTNVAKDKIIQLSAVKVRMNIIDNKPISLSIIENKKLLLNPMVEIPAEATEIHKITNEMVKGKPSFADYSKSLFNYFNKQILGGYNIKRFDIPLLAEEFARCGMELEVEKIIDSCDIFHEREKRDLTAALKFYCNKEMQGAHDAENDTLATVEILAGQISKYKFNIEECFTKDDGRLDHAGKIVMENGVAVYAFGKDKGRSVKLYPSFGKWMLRNDFTMNTKQVVSKLIYGNSNQK